MSKFFAAGASDIESDESASDDAGIAQVQAQQREQQNMLMYESSSSEEEKRVVRSLKDKRYDALKATIKLINNSLKINDWVATLKRMRRRFLLLPLLTFAAVFDELTKQYEKSKKLILKEGIPRFYVQILVNLEDALAAALQLSKDSRKKWSSSNNRSLNTMKQKLRKYTQAFQRFISQYRAVSSSLQLLHLCA
jgi:translation initiation factor 3 subunit C